MSSFKDTFDREWTVTVNVGTAMRAKEMTDVDLTNLSDAKLLHRLQQETLLGCKVLYALCKPQADERHLSEQDFHCGIDGDVADEAGKALATELINFTRKDLRPILREVEERTERVRAKVLAEAAQIILDPAMETRLLDHALGQARAELAKLGSSSGDAPAPSTSTLAPSPSDSS
jgi:uncharacterized membrane protein